MSQSSSVGFIVAIIFCIYLGNVQCRFVSRNYEIEPPSDLKPVHGQARIFPPALLAAKKLLLLKFKKLLPLKFVLLRSDGATADLIEAYPTSVLPDNLEFISTPNGIAGHEDIQAIAIPSSITKTQESVGLLPQGAAEILAESQEKDEDEKETLSTLQNGRKHQTYPKYTKSSSSYRTLLKNVPLALYSVEEEQIKRKFEHKRNNVRRSHYEY